MFNDIYRWTLDCLFKCLMGELPYKSNIINKQIDGSREALDSILTTLEKSGKSGVFFFAPEELSVHGDMVRRLLGTGHSVGILVQAGTPEGARAELKAGNRALAEQTRSCTRYVYCGEALWEGLEAEGWVCWQESLDAVPLDGEQSAASYSPRPASSAELSGVRGQYPDGDQAVRRVDLARPGAPLVTGPGWPA